MRLRHYALAEMLRNIGKEYRQKFAKFRISLYYIYKHSTLRSAKNGRSTNSNRTLFF